MSIGILSRIIKASMINQGKKQSSLVEVLKISSISSLYAKYRDDSWNIQELIAVGNFLGYSLAYIDKDDKVVARFPHRCAVPQDQKEKRERSFSLERRKFMQRLFCWHEASRYQKEIFHLHKQTL